MSYLADQLTPDGVMHQALQTQIDNRVQAGKLFVNQQVDRNPGRSSPWDTGSFSAYLRDNTPSTPQFPGAQMTAGSWLDQASKAIGGTEGFEPRAYHGVYSSFRKPGDIFVKPGEVTPGFNQEVSIGYGYNLTGNRDSRQVFQKVLGIDSAGYDKVLNGQAEINPEQAVKLRDYMIYQANNQLSNVVQRPLAEYQRAALVSMVYNFGIGGFRKTGIPDAINSGASSQEVAKLIQNASPNQKKLQGRRQAEALLWSGVSNGASLVASTNSNYTK